MALADLAAREDETPRCPVGRLLIDLDAADSQTLDEWLDDRTLSGRWIEEKLREYGRRVGCQSVGKHRRGDCSCAQ